MKTNKDNRYNDPRFKNKQEDETMTMKTIRQNVTSGNWAVAVVGYRGWEGGSAIGEGITSACCALVTRCETQGEAEALAQQGNAEQRAVLPGTPDVFVYAARRYSKRDYLSQQSRQNGDRDCDRRIVHLG